MTVQQRGIKTPVFKASYLHLFEPYAFNGQGEGKYSVVGIFTYEDIKELQQIVEEVAKEKWPKGKPSKYRSPFRYGKVGEEAHAYSSEQLAKNPEYKGKVMVTMKCAENRPPVVQAFFDGKRVSLNKNDQHLIYSGCYCVADVSIYAYDNIACGVNIGLNGIIKMKDGERLGTTLNADSLFEGIEAPEVDMEEVRF